MKKFNRILSMLLAVFMIMSAFTALTAISTLAEDSETEAEETEKEEAPANKKPLNSQKTEDYTTKIYATPEEKLATMRVAAKSGDFILYVDDFSGEVACENTVTGEKIFTNPYDVGSSTGNSATKYEILSQIIVTFTDNSQGGVLKTFTSYEESALRGQIITEKITGGVRVEYTIGREQAKTLVPRLISLERFEEMILVKLEEAFWDDEANRTTLYDKADTKAKLDVQDFLTRYTLYAMDKLEIDSDKKNSFGYVSDNLSASDRDKARVIKDYPVVAKMPVLVFDTTASEAEIAACEEIILKYCPEYTYEELEWDHAMTDYESEDENPPIFRLALEYKIEDGGLTVKLPANGIRFNESAYTLESIDVLPYMGAGNSGYNGYNFFPDGSGTLFDFAELNTSTTRSIVGKIYGTDYAYHEISGTYQEPIRYPVFGIYEETTYYNYVVKNPDTDEVLSDTTISGAIVDALKAYQKGEKTGVCQGLEADLYTLYSPIINNANAEETKITDKRGFVAIIEEGDALTSLATYHAGSLSDYNTIKMSILPRPKDTYNLQDSISVGSGGDFTIVSDRKYVGSYKIKYVLLSDTTEDKLNLAEGQKASDYKIYDTSWMGMAVAYRQYLTDNKVIEQKDKSEVIDGSIPLYIETFGAVETTKKILSIPVQVMESLTTFKDVEEMYTYLSGQGINNINFKLTGYANGGMYYTVPGNLKFERVVGGNDGFQELLDAAAGVNAQEGKNFGIFPDFDIVYQLGDGWFDGYRQMDHAAKTIDDRYATRREYSATQQKYINYYEIVISPAYFDVLYNRMEKNYAKKYENVIGISVSTLGEYLNSDFDEDEPYNREDSKQFTIEAFQHFDETYGEVMTDGGNAYVWKYADHILNMPLDSSRYIFSSSAVPFVGVVLHGSVSFAGEPLNMEGDMQYAILKAIENGAAPYFILSMDNTEILKEYFDLSQYYSIRYDIWKDDIAGVYSTLNGVLGDVQHMYIIDHEFLEGGVRIPDADELENDILNSLLKDIEDQNNAAEILWWEAKLEASNARKAGKYAEAYAAEATAAVLAAYIEYQKAVNNVTRFDEQYYSIAKEAYEYYYSVEALGDSAATSTANGVVSAVLASGKSYSEFVAKYEAMDKAIADCAAALQTAVDAYVAAHPEITVTVDGKYAVTTITNAHKSYYNHLNKPLAEGATDEEQAAYEAKSAEYLAIINDADLNNMADLYFKHEAAKNAKTKVVNSKFNMDFESYMNADAIENETTAFYAHYINLVKNDKATALVEGWYAKYVENKLAIEKLDSKVTAYSKASTTGNVDNYVAAIAKLAVLEDLGYNVSEDAAKKEQYDKALSIAKNYRISAVNSTAALEGSAYRTIVNYYKNTAEQLALATAAIEVLAKAEGIEIRYVDGVNESERTVNDITEECYNEIAGNGATQDNASGIVKQAIDRARFVAKCLEFDRYEVILDGKECDLTYEGHTLRKAVDKNGNEYFFYGNYETGYSYVAYNADGKLDGYRDPDATYTGIKIDGKNLYQVPGQALYFTYMDTNSNYIGYTYYVYDANYQKYVEKAPVTYTDDDGVANAVIAADGTLAENGTEVFYDAEAGVYFSVNADGTYTRYNYVQSIASCNAYAVANAASSKEAAFALAAQIAKYDATFEADVIKRINRDNAVKEELPEEEADSKYATDNIVAVTYGEEMGKEYKTVILNYNNYTVKITVDYPDDGMVGPVEYTIPAYQFVTIDRTQVENNTEN